MQLAAGKFFEIAEGNGEKVKDVTFVSDKTVEKGIISYAKSVGADLISMSTHARKGWSHMINGSLTEDIANHTELPIMTVKI
jgi:nucleotide-binding universal stress UspA family protein